MPYRWLAQEPILSPDFVLVANSQRTDRRAFLEVVASGDFVAIDAVSRCFFTDIVVNESGRWLLRMTHSVDVP